MTTIIYRPSKSGTRPLLSRVPRPRAWLEYVRFEDVVEHYAGFSGVSA